MPRTPTDTSWTLLPRNATDLERNLLRVPAFDAVFEPSTNSINTAKRAAIPDNWLPWLILEYGIGRLQEFIPDSRELIEEGLAFNRLIGTPAAIYKAAEWLDMEVELVEEPLPTIHFAEFQLKLLSSVPNDMEEVCKLGRAMDIAKPARGRFRRLFNDAWNDDMFVVDQSDWGDILDNYSGVWGPDVGLCGGRELWLSLGNMVDLTPGNGALTAIGTVDCLVWVEEVAIDWIVPYSEPIIDEDYSGPMNFEYSYFMTSGGFYQIGNLVDSVGGIITDENGDPIEYRFEE